MTNDEALAIADASTIDLWRQCAADDAAYGGTHTPDGLREQALDTLAETVRAAGLWHEVKAALLEATQDKLRQRAEQAEAERDEAIRLATDYLGVEDPALRSLACVQAAVEHAERLRADVVQQAARIAELEGEAASMERSFGDQCALKALALVSLERAEARITELEAERDTARAEAKRQEDRATLFGKGFSDYHYLRNSIHDDGEEPSETLAEAVARVNALYLRGEQQEKRIMEIEAAVVHVLSCEAALGDCCIEAALDVTTPEMHERIETARAGEEP